MKQILILLIVFFVVFSFDNDQNHHSEGGISSKNNSKKHETFGIVIHGGAGTILKQNMTDSLESAYLEKLEEAIKIGHTILSKGGTSLKAVTATINIMEDSPLFNAGKGAVFTHEETNELDASIMDGATLNAGAVSGVKHIKNPIDLALSVMNDSPHVMLSGEGAEEFAREQGFKMTDPSYFYTEKRMQSLQKIKEIELRRHYKSLSFEDPFIKDSKFGTVGCVALDKNGKISSWDLHWRND